MGCSIRSNIFCSWQSLSQIVAPKGTSTLMDIRQQMRDSFDSMSWEELQQLRVKYEGKPNIQRILAPYEHKAWARETVRDNPAMAPLMALMVPGYQAMKVGAQALGLSDKEETPPSMQQLSSGFKGIYEGLQQRYSK